MVLVAWSNLPTELVGKIADYLPSRTDKLRLRSVCSTWRAALRHHSNHRPRPHSRVTPYNGGFNPVCNTDTDIHLISRTIFLLSPVPNPNPNPNSTYHHFNYISNSNSNFNSSSWLIKTEEIDDGKFRLVHPFSRFPTNWVPKSFPKLINLSDIRILELGHEYVLHHTCYRFTPSRKFHNFYLKKVVYLPVGYNDDYAVLTILMSEQLAMFRSIDKQWKIIDYDWCSFNDIVSFNGMFYAVDYTGRTVAISPDSGDIVVVVSEFKLYGENKHLLQMDNELILVDSNNSITSSVLTESEEEDEEEDEDEDEEENLVFAPFAIYKLDRDGSRWAKIDDLGDRVLFLGKNSTFSASASDLNWYDPKGNYICYSNTDDLQSYQVACQNVRAYDMKAAMYCYHDQRYYSKLFWPVPSWVTSTP